MKVGLLIIATDKYTRFLKNLISSADKFFCKNHEVNYFIFSNLNNDVQTERKLNIFNIEHKPWPWMTLGRYHIFYDHYQALSQMDYLYYCDADMLMVDEIGDEIFSDRVATQHPGFFGERGTPEFRNKSLAYIDPSEKMEYFAGGFNGGSSKEYLKMCKILSENIKKDLDNDIIAIWHDESHINRYFIDNPPTKILTPSYCFGEGMNIPFEPKLIALNKNHTEIRST